MGCISSKRARCESPDYRRSSLSSFARSRRGRNGRRRSSALSTSSSLVHSAISYGPLEGIKEEPEKEEGLEDEEDEVYVKDRKNESFRALKGNKKGAVFTFKFGRMTEGEQVAAGWPSRLSAVAGEAIEGWLPLRSDSFKRLEKVLFSLSFIDLQFLGFILSIGANLNMAKFTSSSHYKLLK